MERRELEILINKVKNQDKEAFEELYRASLPFILKIGRAYRFKDALMEDITQEVFLQITKSIYELKNTDCYMKWVMQITRSKCCKYLRNEKNHETLYEERIGDNVNDIIKKISMNQQVEKILKKLNRDYQEVLVMKYLKGLSEKEIAKNLQIPLGTAKSRLYHARSRAHDIAQSA